MFRIIFLFLVSALYLVASVTFGHYSIYRWTIEPDLAVIDLVICVAAGFKGLSTVLQMLRLSWTRFTEWSWDRRHQHDVTTGDPSWVE